MGLQCLVARRIHDCEMKIHVRLRIDPRIPGIDHSGLANDEVSKLPDGPCIGALGRKSRSNAVDDLAQSVSVQKACAIDRCDPNTASGLMGQKTVALENAQRLAQWRTADAQFRRDLLLPKNVSRGVASGIDSLTQGVGDFIEQTGLAAPCEGRQDISLLERGQRIQDTKIVNAFLTLGKKSTSNNSIVLK